MTKNERLLYTTLATLALFHILMWILGITTNEGYDDIIVRLFSPVKEKGYALYILLAIAFGLALLYVKVIYKDKTWLRSKIVLTVMLTMLFIGSFTHAFEDYLPFIGVVLGIAWVGSWMFAARYVGKRIGHEIDKRKTKEEQINLDQAYKSTDWASNDDLNKI